MACVAVLTAMGCIQLFLIFSSLFNLLTITAGRYAYSVAHLYYIGIRYLRVGCNECLKTYPKPLRDKEHGIAGSHGVDKAARTWWIGHWGWRGYAYLLTDLNYVRIGNLGISCYECIKAYPKPLCDKEHGITGNYRIDTSSGTRRHMVGHRWMVWRLGRIWFHRRHGVYGTPRPSMIVATRLAFWIGIHLLPSFRCGIYTILCISYPD